MSNARLSVRDSTINWREVVLGDKSSLILNKYHPYEDLPKLINPTSGYIFNTNNSPFNSTEKMDNLKEINFNSSFSFKEKENNRSSRFMELISRYDRISYSDFKEIVPDQSEGDFGQKLKDLTEKTAGGKNSGYWREALDKQFNLSFDVGNSSKHSGYYFVTDINHPTLDVIPMLGSKTEKILCLMIYETDSEISNLLVCKDPEHDMLVLGEYAGESF